MGQAIETGQHLLAKELHDVHSAEQLLSKALPRFSKKVSSEEVREKLKERLKDSEEILEATERALTEIAVKTGRKRSHAVEALIEDAKQVTGQMESEDVCDATLIAEMQKIQHYCLAAWGTIAAHARENNQQSLVDVMERALAHGKQFDRELTQLAETAINPRIFARREREDRAGGPPSKGIGEHPHRQGRRSKRAEPVD